MADKFINETGLQTVKTWINNKFATETEVSALSDRVDEIISEGGEPNTIETVKVNGTALTPDAQKAVNVTVPINTSSLTNDGDGNSNFATEDYVAQNGGKIDVIQVNGTAQTITNKTVNIAVPTRLSELDNDGDGTTGSEYATVSYVDTNGGKIDTIAVNNVDQSVVNKKVNITVPVDVSELENDAQYQTLTDVQDLIAESITSAYKFKGTVPTVADLPATGNEVGDVWDVESNGVNYAWDGENWDALGHVLDATTLWSNESGHENSLIAMTVAEINAILNA